jgi:hypothetical protein
MQCDTAVQTTCPVFGHGVMLFLGVDEVVCIDQNFIFDTKLI